MSSRLTQQTTSSQRRAALAEKQRQQQRSPPPMHFGCGGGNGVFPPVPPLRPRPSQAPSCSSSNSSRCQSSESRRSAAISRQSTPIPPSIPQTRCRPHHSSPSLDKENVTNPMTRWNPASNKRPREATDALSSSCNSSAVTSRASSCEQQAQRMQRSRAPARVEPSGSLSRSSLSRAQRWPVTAHKAPQVTTPAPQLLPMSNRPEYSDPEPESLRDSCVVPAAADLSPYGVVDYSQIHKELAALDAIHDPSNSSNNNNITTESKIEESQQLPPRPSGGSQRLSSMLLHRRSSQQEGRQRMSDVTVSDATPEDDMDMDTCLSMVLERTSSDVPPFHCEDEDSYQLPSAITATAMGSQIISCCEEDSVLSEQQAPAATNAARSEDSLVGDGGDLPSAITLCTSSLSTQEGEDYGRSLFATMKSPNAKDPSRADSSARASSGARRTESATSSRRSSVLSVRSGSKTPTSDPPTSTSSHQRSSSGSLIEPKRRAHLLSETAEKEKLQAVFHDLETRWMELHQRGLVRDTMQQLRTTEQHVDERRETVKENSNAAPCKGLPHTADEAAPASHCHSDSTNTLLDIPCESSLFHHRSFAQQRDEESSRPPLDATETSAPSNPTPDQSFQPKTLSFSSALLHSSITIEEEEMPSVLEVQTAVTRVPVSVATTTMTNSSSSSSSSSHQPKPCMKIPSTKRTPQPLADHQQYCHPKAVTVDIATQASITTCPVRVTTVDMGTMTDIRDASSCCDCRERIKEAPMLPNRPCCLTEERHQEERRDQLPRPDVWLRSRESLAAAQRGQRTLSDFSPTPSYPPPNRAVCSNDDAELRSSAALADVLWSEDADDVDAERGLYRSPPPLEEPVHFRALVPRSRSWNQRRRY